MEKDPLLDWEGEGGNIGMQATERPQPSAPDDRPLDPRVRRGSLGPPPLAAPLGAAASGAALQAHLVHLLDVTRMDVARAEAVVSLPRPPTAERLSPHEDVQRLPDGVPHMVIGLTALFSVALAAILIGLCFAGPSLGLIGAAVLIIVSLPSLVFWLNAKAENGRDHDHPSR